MATKFFLPSKPILFTIFSTTRIIGKTLYSKPSIFRPFCSLSLVQDVVSSPSLCKGRKPSICKVPELFNLSPVVIPDVKADEGKEDSVIDEESFSRVFNILAIQVPSEECFVLENQLRGHLLNWPHIRNVARVPGDEGKIGFTKTLPEKVPKEDKEENFNTLNRHIYGKIDGNGAALSSVLPRDNPVKSFNSSGSAKCKDLANISSSKKKEKLTMEVEMFHDRKRIGKDVAYGIEVVSNRDTEEDDISGLSGNETRVGQWRGPTRLLLLGEQYTAIDVDELPEAIKALLKGGIKEKQRCALVTCRLTLFYNYWQVNEILEDLLPKDMIVPTAFETVGHIAHLNLRDEHLPYKKIIAQVVLDKNKPKIKTVVNKIDSIQNEYRTMQLEILAGNHSLITTVVENGFRFHVDLAAVYWNSRLATERQRLVNRFSSSDIICDVFSGVGPLAIAAAKKVKHVYANDLNPSAVEYLEKNCVFNKLDRKITVFNMDGRRFIDYAFRSQNAFSITHVVMNLPNEAAEFLDTFRGIFRERSRSFDTVMPMIHVYGFSKAQDPELDFHERIKNALLENTVEMQMHRVRVVAPGKWMLCASFVLPESVAFAKQN